MSQVGAGKTKNNHEMKPELTVPYTCYTGTDKGIFSRNLIHTGLLLYVKGEHLEVPPVAQKINLKKKKTNLK